MIKMAVWQIALCVRNRLGTTKERLQEGDIVTASTTWGSGVGRKAGSGYLWLRIDLFEDINLVSSVYADYTDIDSVRYDKRRYCIPLDRLKKVCPTLDLGRARDRNDKYQPFLMIDEDTHLFLFTEQPLQAGGLVYDKEVGDYI